MRLHYSTRGGFTLAEVMVLAALIGLLASVAFPNYVKARGTAQRGTCLNNLRHLDDAVKEWALDYRMDPTHAVTLNDTIPYLKSAVICPAGGTTIFDSYTVTEVSKPPTCKSPGGGSVAGHNLP